MGTLLEEFNSLKIKVAAAQARGDQATLHRKIHIVDHEAERERKRTNPKASTRITLNCRSVEAWKEFQMAKERFFEIATDPHIAVDLMIRALQWPTDDEIKAWLKEGHGEPGTQPPKAEIPDWMRD